jgi:DNA-binding beta-propeller fold protein YncE
MHRLAKRRLGIALAMLVLALVPLAWGQAGVRAAQSPGPNGSRSAPLDQGACQPGKTRGCGKARAASQVTSPLTASQVTFSGPQAAQYSVSQIINLNPYDPQANGRAYPNGSAFDSTNSTVYVTDFYYAVLALNTQTGGVQAIKDPRICAPNSVAVDPSLNKIFVAEQSDFGCGEGFTSNMLVVIDGNTNTVQAAIPISQNPLYPAKTTVNTATHMVYVANQTNNNCPPTCGNVAVVNGLTNTLVTNITDPRIQGPLGIGADPKSNQVYVGDNVDGSYYPNQVTTINGSTNSVTAVAQVGQSPGAIKVGQQSLFPFLPPPLSTLFSHSQPFLAQGADYDSSGSVQAFTSSGVTSTFPVTLPCGYGESNLATGQQLYASAPGNDAVAVLDPNSGAVNAVIKIGAGCDTYGPTEMSVVPGSYFASGSLYINLAFTGQVLVISGAK